MRRKHLRLRDIKVYMFLVVLEQIFNIPQDITPHNKHHPLLQQHQSVPHRLGTLAIIAAQRIFIKTTKILFMASMARLMRIKSKASLCLMAFYHLPRKQQCQLLPTKVLRLQHPKLQGINLCTISFLLRTIKLIRWGLNNRDII
ncbi:MAG: hypothetical protein NEHIOOID_01072 [Holosporales bacterium]